MELAGLGARRSATAWESLRQRALDSDAILDVTSLEGARRVAEAARAVPGVAEAVPMAYIVERILGCEHRGVEY